MLGFYSGAVSVQGTVALLPPAFLLHLLSQHWILSLTTLLLSVGTYGEMQEINTKQEAAFMASAEGILFVTLHLLSFPPPTPLITRVLLLLPRVIPEIVNSAFCGVQNLTPSVQTQLSLWPCKLGWQRSDSNCIKAVKVDFKPLWNYNRERENVSKLNFLCCDGKFGGRKQKTSITGVGST